MSETPLSQISDESEDNEIWLLSYIQDSLTYELGRSKMVVTNNKQKIFQVYKYYYQAHQLRKTITVAKPTPNFYVHLSDLSPKLVLELNKLSGVDREYVLRMAVGQIFENIGARFYHTVLARHLKVVLVE